MTGNDMMAMVNRMTPEDRVMLAQIALGDWVTKPIIQKGSVVLYGYGQRYAIEPANFVYAIDGELAEKSTPYWEDALEVSVYSHKGISREVAQMRSDITDYLLDKEFSWQYAVVSGPIILS